MPRFRRLPLQGIMWLFVPMGVFLLAIGVYAALFSHDADKWSAVTLGLVWPSFAFFMSRHILVAVGLEGDDLLVRHAFPGWVERVPLPRVRRGRVVRRFFSVSIVFSVVGSVPMQFAAYAPGCTPIPHWEDLLAALKARLASEGRG